MLVLDLVGPDGPRVGDSEQGEANVEPAVARTRREIRLLAGTLQPSKVHTAVGVFGGPPVGGDGAERAVRAALRVAEALAVPGEPPAVSVDAAVHTGVYPPSADPPAGDRKLVPPEAAQVAARLLGNSAPGVVVDRPTHDETRHLFEYEPLDGPSPAWVARAARGSYGIDLELGLPTPFTGRDHELALLTDIYARVLMESSPHLVTVVGEAGAGKSRLLSEFLSALDSRPELVYWRQGRSLAGALGRGGGVTLWALGEVVKGQAGILESDDLRTAREKVDVATRNLLPDPGERDRVGPLLDPLVGLVGPDPAPVPRRRSFPAWLRFLEAMAATHTLVLVFEDLHLADPGTLAFLHHIAEHASGVPLLMICTARFELMEHDRTWGGATAGGAHSTTITLGPLPGRDARELIGAMGGPVEAGGTPPVELLEAAGGNPLYLEMYLGLLGDPSMAGREPPPPPPTFAALMSARLDALDKPLRELIEDAAVVGKVFWPGAVAAIGGRDEEGVATGLAELVRRNVVRSSRRSSVAGQTEHAFWHLALRDAAAEHMDPARRAAAHRAALDWATSMTGDRVADHAEILANHVVAALDTDRGGNLDPARRYLRLAADRAAGLDPSRAAELYGRAAELHPPESRERAGLLARANAMASEG